MASQQSAPPKADKFSATAFKKFQAERRAAQGRKPLNVIVKAVVPTDERLHKADRPRKTDAGHYRAPPPLERLHMQGKLDGDPHVSAAMFTAGSKLYETYFNSGLSEHIKAMALDGAGTGGGLSTAASYMPVSEFMATQRERFQDAQRAMGWHEGFPYRGCGRLVVDIVCREMALRDAAPVHFPNTRLESAQAMAMDRLREGLFLLAKHWRLINTREVRHGGSKEG